MNRCPVPAPIRADGLSLDNLAEGSTFRSESYEVSAAEVKEFASRWNPQLFHLDADSAAGTFLGGTAGTERNE
ncbi:MAG: hypothetical protein ABS81_01305 [Pseudonocardia sp. SCN 72-86]|nr:MAG: hypothetical protein ABS81_01305 [Pseudonocardia sp. SCN 72-86]